MWLHKQKWKTWSELHALNAVSVKCHSLTSQVNNDVSRSRPQCLKDSTWYLTESLPCKSKRPSLSEPIHFRTGVFLLVCTPFGEIHTFCLSLTSKLLDLKLLSESELKMQEPFNSCQTTRRPKGTRFFWQKNKPNEVLQLENDCNQILRLWTPYLMSPSSDPKNLSVLPRKTVYLISP